MGCVSGANIGNDCNKNIGDYVAIVFGQDPFDLLFSAIEVAATYQTLFQRTANRIQYLKGTKTTKANDEAVVATLDYGIEEYIRSTAGKDIFVNPNVNSTVANKLYKYNNQEVYILYITNLGVIRGLKSTDETKIEAMRAKIMFNKEKGQNDTPEFSGFSVQLLDVDYFLENYYDYKFTTIIPSKDFYALEDVKLTKTTGSTWADDAFYFTASTVVNGMKIPTAVGAVVSGLVTADFVVTAATDGVMTGTITEPVAGSGEYKFVPATPLTVTQSVTISTVAPATLTVKRYEVTKTLTESITV